MREKLLKTRKKLHFMQQDLAECLKISLTQYQRKEHGKAKIFDNEWEKMAKLMNVSVDEIFEETDKEPQNIENLENISSSCIGNHNLFCNVPDYVLQDLHSLISELREENKMLKQEIERLMEEIKH